ncbi:MAG: hypothetical protein N2376_09080 [Clostridia bacterium]|nr:hypothetical protein [Clostridia bacterium]
MSQNAIVDCNAFKTETGLDDATVKELYGIFTGELSEQKERLVEAFQKGDCESLRKINHNVKGISLSYKAFAVYDSAKLLDQLLKAGETKNLVTPLNGLVNRMEEAIEAIGALELY